MKRSAIPHLALQPVEELEDLRLDRHVERRRRLVRHEQLRPTGERHGDHGALPLSARELVRVVVDPPLRLGNAGRRQELDGPGAAGASAEPGMQREHLADLRADRVQRVERCHRLLEDHGDLAAADGPHLALRLPAQVLAAEADHAPRGGAVDEPQDRERRHRLAGPRFADQGDLLAGRDGEGHVVDHRRPPEADRQVLDR
jgi:hypothetical protein